MTREKPFLIHDTLNVYLLLESITTLRPLEPCTLPSRRQRLVLVVCPCPASPPKTIFAFAEL